MSPLRLYREGVIIETTIWDENKLFEDLQEMSISSMDFWDNEIDDEAWSDI
ncbi:MAG: hypothetical protein FWB71_07580 [Defluviitaleaceae bacterium]|nr:hypothetical protein [Defluviitaleaceae bacterium]